MRSVDDLTAAARIRDAAIERFGEQGFSVGLRSIAEAAGVSAALVIHHFGSKDGLRKACDDYVAEEIRSSKSEAMNSSDPATWFGAAGRDRGVRTPDGLPGTQHANRWRPGEDVLAHDDGQRRELPGRRCPYRHPEAQPRSGCPGQSILAITGGGGFLLYIQMHDTPTDLRAVLRDYARDMMLPSLELYTEGLMTDSHMYEAFLAQAERQNAQGESDAS